MKPLLKWTGSKYNQSTVYSHVQRVFNSGSYKTFAEPFCGGLGMTHRVEADRHICCDINPWLITFYNEIKEGYEWELEYSQKSYKELRQDLGNPTAFYLVNKCSFNGLFRTNSRLVFNVPGNGKKPSDVDLPDLKPYREFYKRIEFRTCNVFDFEYEPNSLVYFDPPYFGTFSDYEKDSFTALDHLRLISKIKYTAILSNSAHPNLLTFLHDSNIDYIELETPQTFNNSTMKESLAFINI